MESSALQSAPKTRREPKIYSFDEYLKKEERSKHKHEFQNGKLKLMPGGTLFHSNLAVEFLRLLANFFAENRVNAITLNSDLKIQIPAYNKTVYPDGSVIFGKPEWFRGSQSVILNPTLILEVLSDSTEEYDRTEKFDQYQTIPSLREYVLVNQNRPEIEVFFRQKANDPSWKFTRSVGLEAKIRLDSVGCELALSEVYRSVAPLW